MLPILAVFQDPVILVTIINKEVLLLPKGRGDGWKPISSWLPLKQIDSKSNNTIDKEDQPNLLNIEINHVHDNLCKKCVWSCSKFQYSREFTVFNGRKEQVEKD